MNVFTDLDHFRGIIALQKQEKRYSDLEQEYGVNRFYLWNIIHDESYKPPVWVYIQLGINRFELAPACTACGEVHAYDRACEKQVVIRDKPKPPRPRKWRDARTPQGLEFFDLPVKVLRAALENREVVKTVTK